MQCVLKYPGAKNRLAGWIASFIPEHKVYCEPYAGSLAVLFAKPRSHIETVNDLDGEIVNFFRVIRERPEEFGEMLRLTPYSREEYQLAFEPAGGPVERARRFAIRCWMGFGSAAGKYQTGFRSGQQSNSPNPAKAWAKYPEVVQEAVGRLQGVQIENQPALELLRRYDTEDVFFYLDPPYLHDTRTYRYFYNFEMAEADHEELLQAVVSHPGRFMVSGYDNELYNDYLSGWHKAYRKTQIESGAAKQEVLWLNYELGRQFSLFDK
ncbi:MAG: DNA adenine methylase [Clostridiales bacterium]|nr:DNA adenine methylase [Clostridiales bacterium]